MNRRPSAPPASPAPRVRLPPMIRSYSRPSCPRTFSMADRILRAFSSRVKSKNGSVLNGPSCRRTWIRGGASMVAIGVILSGLGELVVERAWNILHLRFGGERRVASGEKNQTLFARALLLATRQRCRDLSRPSQDLSDHFESGQRLSPQNRPMAGVQDLHCFTIKLCFKACNFAL